MPKQLDSFNDDLVRMAKAYREAADHSLHDTQFAERERQDRSAYYRSGAKRWELSAAFGGQQIDGKKEPQA